MAIIVMLVRSTPTTTRATASLWAGVVAVVSCRTSIMVRKARWPGINGITPGMTKMTAGARSRRPHNIPATPATIAATNVARSGLAPPPTDTNTRAR